MPNYVANIVSFHGDDERIKEMLSAVQNDKYGPGSISFNKIIPMPPELDIESGSRSKEGLRAYNDFIEAFSLGRKLSKNDLLHIPTKVENDYLRKHSGIDRETWNLGRKAFQNIQKYGAPDWYDWRWEHWNTKWDAGGYDENTDYSKCESLIFRTAWQEPAPVIQKLSAMYPDIEFTHSWAEEQLGYYCGTAKYLAGKQTEHSWQGWPDVSLTVRRTSSS
ncbi:hypothetical protein [Acutalibacter muris]|uniref:DUF1281 family ferredoxin-like fold protein n=1 Tax=Acutalibacter muris TaxID=1796620 RepID=UPI001C3EB7CC|nr:hypothetical protein [Acutalibacter muris]